MEKSADSSRARLGKAPRPSPESGSGIHVVPVHEGPRPELVAVVEAVEMLREGRSLRQTFPNLVAVLRRVLDLRTLVIASDADDQPLVWHASDSGVDEAQAVSTAALDYFCTRRSFDDLARAGEGEAEAARWFTLPIVRDSGCVVGVLAASVASASSEESLVVLGCVARHLGNLLIEETVRPDESERTLAAARLHASVSRATALLMKSLDSMVALRDFAQAVASELASGCVVDIVDAPERTVVCVAAMPDDQVVHAIAPVVDAVIASGEALEGGDPRVKAATRALGIRGLICVPMVDDGISLGAVTFLGCEFGPPEIPIDQAMELGHRAAVATMNARQHTRALATGRQREDALAMVSHDLRSPLGVISMAVEFLLAEEEEKEAGRASRPQLEAIGRAARQMRKLVDDLVDVAAFEAGRLSIRPSSCPLEPLVLAALEMLGPLAASANVRLERPHVGARASRTTVWADGDRVLQVLLNLLSNALKFTPSGAAVRVTLTDVGDKALVTVEDDGCGISKEELSHIFDPFWKSPSHRQRGAGLGLAICKHIVELSGGLIWARSSVGKGTAISFTLPLDGRTASRSGTPHR